jgi:hypothetical protein
VPTERFNRALGVSENVVVLDPARGDYLGSPCNHVRKVYRGLSGFIVIETTEGGLILLDPFVARDVARAEQS